LAFVLEQKPDLAELPLGIVNLDDPTSWQD